MLGRFDDKKNDFYAYHKCALNWSELGTSSKV